MKRRVSEKVLRRIGRACPPLVYPESETSPHSAWEVAERMYRRGTVIAARDRRSLNSGGTVCLDCAVTMGLDRC